jgi:acetolactate synthase I/II/III large subunit
MPSETGHDVTTHPPAAPVAAERNARIRGADLLAEALISAGIDTLFGVPGDTGVVFYDALYARQDRLRHVLARDERHAGAMADAYARIRNRVGVVEVSSGGGTTYVIGSLGEASAAGVPVLVVTSDIHRASRGTGALTEIDQVALFAAVTKRQFVVDRAGDIPGAVLEAVTAAVSGRPGPVVVIVPEDVLDEPVTPSSLQAPAAETVSAEVGAVPASRVPATEEDVRATALMLARAVRPVIIAGSGVHSSLAWDELAAVAQRRAIPVATTIHGKGAIADTHPLSIGVVGNNGARSYANDIVAAADAVLIVGSRANATDTNSWTGPPRRGVPIAQIDVCAERAGRNFPDATALTGDARTVLAQLLAHLDPVDSAVLDDKVRDIMERRGAWVRRGPPGASEVRDGQLEPARVVTLLNQVLGPDTLVLADAGTPTPNVACYWETVSPGRTVIAPRGHGPMGYAIPGAIGACFARPGRTVLSVTADGSLAMACGELETAARFRLPILFVQFTNFSLGWIKMLQHLYTEGRYFGVDPGPIDAIAVARACGLDGERVTSLARLEELAAGFAADPRPFYVDIEVPHPIEYTPPVSSWVSALNGNAARPVY